ncbi:MAG: FecR family protein [Bacteroidota bacterium]
MSASFEFIEKLVCDDRFCKYVLNPDPATVEYWNEFRKNNPDKEEEIKEARQLVLLLGDEKEIRDIYTNKRVESIWDKIQSETSGSSSADENRKSRNQLLFFSLKVAAVLIFMALISFIILDIRPDTDNQSFSSNENYFQRVTEYGQKASFYLPDGSYVILNAGSSLHYSVCNECSARELTLKGEAFFDVKRDPDHPFIVKTEKISATVLGTSFNVKAYPEEDLTEVALVTGKVSVTNQFSEPQLLLPNQMATYSHVQKNTLVSDFDQTLITGWKDKILVFEDVSFSDLIMTLSRWYGVEFIISESVKNNKKLIDRKDYKGKYSNKSLETVLEAISFSYDFEYKINGKKVLIK